MSQSILKKLRSLASLLILGGVLTTGAACRETRNRNVPEELLGIWTTNDPRYEDRYFELTTEATMIVGTGEGNSDTYIITNIESVTVSALTDYTLSYFKNAGNEYKFRFRYDPFDNGIIRFVNQKALKWRRKEP